MRSLNNKTISETLRSLSKVCCGACLPRVLANELNVERSRNLQSFTQLLRNTLANQVDFTAEEPCSGWSSKFGRSWPFLIYFPLEGQIPPVDHPGSESCHSPQWLPTRSVASLFGMAMMWRKGPV